MMQMGLVTAFVEVVKAIALPTAFVIITWWLKPGLLSFLVRIKEVEGFGIKAKSDLAEQQQGAAENPATEKLPKPIDPSPSAAVNIVETRLRDDLKRIEAEKREATLLRALAATRVVAGHEFTYNRIFGSQIVALKRLNEAGRVTVDFAREIYKPYAKQFPQAYSNYSFDGWLGFLTSSGLVMQNGNSLEITDIGRDFLHYLTERRLSELKLL